MSFKYSNSKRIKEKLKMLQKNIGNKERKLSDTKDREKTSNDVIYKKNPKFSKKLKTKNESNNRINNYGNDSFEYIEIKRENAKKTSLGVKNSLGHSSNISFLSKRKYYNII
jgi:hypothetical protein